MAKSPQLEMKKYIPHIIAFLVGALIASLVFLLIRANEKKIDENGVLVKTETITKVDTIVVTKEKIVTEVVTKNGPTEYIYVELPQEIVRDTIYKEIPLKKEYYHSVTDDVEIWHSGVASSIDKVVNYRETQVVNNVYRKDKKNTISLGLDMGYHKAFRMPLQLSYEYNITSWFSMGAYAEYEPLQRTFGGGMKAKVKIEW